MNNESDIRRRLEDTVGLIPCSEWFQACLAHLHETATNQTLTADQVLFQVLHTDLRDVVRPTTGNQTTTLSVRQLETAIQQSNQGKQELTSSFQLLCQVEELLDVSLNAEHRYAHGPANPRDPTPVGNQSKRCLKLCLSHGHADASSPIAMEITPIPSLSANTLAGTKLLLKGPIDVRWGVLLLYPGNTTVLGGNVAELVEVQKKALEQAKLTAGVNIDPTVRALIGTDPLDLEEPTDEGEGESRDVAPAPPPPPVQMPPPTTAPSTTHTNRVVTAPVPPQTRYPPASMITPTAMDISTPATATTTASPVPSRPNASTPAVSTTSTTISTTTAPLRSNPYGSTGPSHRATSVACAASNPYSGPSSTNSRTANNPYQRPSNQTPQATRALPSEVDDSSPTPMDIIPPRQTPSTNNTESPHPPSSVSTAISVPRPSTSNPPTTSMEQAMTFPNLCSLLKQLVQNRSMYESYMGLVFRVELVKRSGQMHFNIEKNRDYKKHKDAKKYQIVIHATFGCNGTNNAELLSCKLPSSLIEPFFDRSPADLRALSRQDRQLSQQIVTQGGERVKQEFFCVRTWKASLYPTANDVFANPQPMALDDVQTPILILEPAVST